ncbi:high frequency lysogenization protein HflD [Thiohalomonas denitrificans]|uniref:High frequency lysogenization protein HflD homolog n=1 Tax=Thiohalomonas denitrificans TaxID=415747 RepID=A0A1G5QC47_9GAMM|nr:high frequency lysogenization protein HflD [Thiohalomonas denitrificans]SCZ59208.1 high frequency lysogenization protein [Thiohalomonas denitrificans]
MNKSVTDKTLALAGIFQAVYLVDQVARRGSADPAAFETSIRSLFATTPKSAEDVYGSSRQLQTGLECLQSQLGSGDTPRNLELTRYAIGILHLERKLSKKPRNLDNIGKGIDRARRQAEHFSLTHENVVASLADTYVNSVSILTPRIMVAGEHGHLNQSANANRVRALLLSAIRSAVLWKQSGGGRLQLLFRRKAFLDEAQRLLG